MCGIHLNIPDEKVAAPWNRVDENRIYLVTVFKRLFITLAAGRDKYRSTTDGNKSTPLIFPDLKEPGSIQYIYLFVIVTGNEMHYG